MLVVKPYVCAPLSTSLANTSPQGAICLDTLSSAWSPVLTIKSALLSLQSLLSTPEPKDPQDAEVAKMLMVRPKEFERVAAEWAEKYAGAPKRERGETSGGATAESLKKRVKKSKEQEEAERVAQYVDRTPLFYGPDIGVVDMEATMSRWWTALSIWALTAIESLQLSISWGSIRMEVNTMRWRRLIWVM